MIDSKKDNKFFPYYFFEITLVVLFTIEVVLVLAVLFPPTIGREIDFSAQFSPRPEWYFLFLYQLTKYFSRRMDIRRRRAAAGPCVQRRCSWRRSWTAAKRPCSGRGRRPQPRALACWQQWLS